MPERRSGFDRRHPGGFLLRVSRDSGLLLVLLVLLNALSLIDWTLTLSALGRGATEANLALAALLNASPLAATAFKALVILAVSIGIWCGRRYRSVVAVAIGAVALFGLVVSYHLAALAVAAGG